MAETVITSKGQTTIPDSIRKELGLGPGTVLSWSIDGSKAVAQKKAGELNAMQRHIRAKAGTWKGKISGQELLRRTRGLR